MTVTKHKAYEAAAASALTTELNSLANSANCTASSAIDNSSNVHLYMDIELVVAAQGAARSSGAYVGIYMVQALDGTNYDDTNEVTAEMVCAFVLDNTTTARRASRRNIPIPPGTFKLFARNQTGQALAASGNTVKYRIHSLEST